MSQQFYTHILWDWNGTLLDDVSAALASVNDMLTRRGKDIIDIIRYRECIGVPIICFYEQVFDLDNEDYPALLAEYNEGYLRHLDGCGLAKGARELLSDLHRQGKRQIIVSSCEKNQLLAAVKSFGIEDCFDAIIGSDNFLAGSKIDKAREYLAANGDGNMRAVVVGDLVHDCELARAVGADCILLRSGHENANRLEHSGARLVDDFCEIRTFVQDTQ